MQKEEYIKQEIIHLTQSLGALLLLIGAAINISLSLLDYFVVPEHFSQFFMYRLFAASLLMGMHFAFKNEKDSERDRSAGQEEVTKMDEYPEFNFLLCDTGIFCYCPLE